MTRTRQMRRDGQGSKRRTKARKAGRFAGGRLGQRRQKIRRLHFQTARQLADCVERGALPAALQHANVITVQVRNLGEFFLGDLPLKAEFAQSFTEENPGRGLSHERDTFQPTAGLAVAGGTLNLGSGLMTCVNGFSISAGTLEMNGNEIDVPANGEEGPEIDISGGTLNLSGLISDASTAGAVLNVSGGTINNTGPSGEIQCWSASFTGGTSEIQTLTIREGNYSQSDDASVTIDGGLRRYGGCRRRWFASDVPICLHQIEASKIGVLLAFFFLVNNSCCSQATAAKRQNPFCWVIRADKEKKMPRPRWSKHGLGRSLEELS